MYVQVRNRELKFAVSEKVSSKSKISGRNKKFLDYLQRLGKVVINIVVLY